MPNIVFNPWTITPAQASIEWTVYPDNVTTIDHIEYRVWRDTDTPSTQTTTSLTSTVTLNVTNFTGVVFAEVNVYDTQGTVTNLDSQFSVNNKVKPTAPDWLTFSAFTDSSLTVQWGAAYVAPVNTQWRLYHRNNSNVTVLLGTYPVSQLSASVLISTATLNDLYVTGVDTTGLESAPSPLLDFTPAVAGPTVDLSVWTTSPTSASISFTASAPLGLSSLTWQLLQAGIIVQSGTSEATVTLNVANYQGLLELRVVAVDTAFTVRSVNSTVQLWNQIPRPPIITVQALSATSIQLLVDRDPADPVTVPYADLTGLALTLRESVPFVQTYTSLQPDTAYTFSARSVNPGGLFGPNTPPLIVTTFSVVEVSPPLPGALVPGPILSQLMTWLVGDLLNYLLQSSTDTRIRSPLSPQIAVQPVTLYPFLNMVAPIASDLGRIVREETNDQASYDASLVIDRAGDTLQKLSILCERITYGSIVNKAF